MVRVEFQSSESPLESIVEYLDHQIRIVVRPRNAAELKFQATYEIKRNGAETGTWGTIAGGFFTPENAMKAALVAAKRSIKIAAALPRSRRANSAQ